jgi:hypothetical protein
MAPPPRRSAVIKTKCDEPPFLGSTFIMKVSPESGCPGQPLTTRRSPSSFSRMSGVVWLTWAACGGEAIGTEVFTHTKIAQTAILGRTVHMRWLPTMDARKSLMRVMLQFKLAKHRLSDNVGGVKHFLSTQPHPLEEERHFALSEKQLPLPTKARA